MSKYPVITIDGPSGSGKGTISQLLAEKLGWHYLDSGAIYRLLALKAIETNTDLNNEAALAKLAQHLKIKFEVHHRGDVPTILLEGKDVTTAIRSEKCSSTASMISAFPLVRQALLERQRAFLQSPGLVTDGRDMGTVVFPDAAIKIYLNASLDERAHRRYLQLIGKKLPAVLEDIHAEIQRRDIRDATRTTAPLKPAPDAVVIDTTGLDITQVLDKILKLLQSKGLN